jgi:hypothetical protein
MDLSINFDFLSDFLNSYSNPYPKIKFFFYFKLSNSKFARDLQNTQTKTQNPNTQIIENSNLNLNLLVLVGAYV